MERMMDGGGGGYGSDPMTPGSEMGMPPEERPAPKRTARKGGKARRKKATKSKARGRKKARRTSRPRARARGKSGKSSKRSKARKRR